MNKFHQKHIIVVQACDYLLLGMGQTLVDLKITSNSVRLCQNPQVEYKLHKILKKFERLKNLWTRK